MTFLGIIYSEIMLPSTAKSDVEISFPSACDKLTFVQKEGAVLLVSPWYRPNIGGIVEVAEKLFRLLRGARIKTHLLVTDHPGSRHVKADPKQPEVWWCYVLPYVFTRTTVRTTVAFIIRWFGYVWRLARFIRQHNIKSVVLIYPTENAWPFLFLQRILHFRLVVSAHGNDILLYDKLPGTHRWLLRALLRSAAVITAPADHVARQASQISRYSPDRIVLIPNCVDGKYFAPRPIGYRRNGHIPTFIHVSNFAVKKRVADIVRAFALSGVHAATRLVLVGDGMDFQNAVQLAKTMGIETNVFFLGAQHDVRSFLWESDVFVSASDEESGPIALLEAMACGLPFISTGHGVVTMLPPNECGLVVPNRSPKELGEAMALLLQNPELCKRLGRQARYWAEAKFGEEAYLESHLKILSEPLQH